MTASWEKIYSVLGGVAKRRGDEAKTFKTSKNEILRDPDFTLKSKYQHLKLWCMAKKIYKNQKILYVCFEVNRKKHFQP